MNNTELLIALSNAHCIGHQRSAMEVAAEALRDFSTVTIGENQLSAEIKGSGTYTILLEAHIDEIGMIVTAVHDDGFLRVAPVGSIDARILPATPVLVLGKQPVHGVFTSVPPHLKKEDVCPDFDNCMVDTGRTDIGTLVSAGDYVVFDVTATLLSDKYISGKSLDNRSGVAAIIEAGRKIAAAKCATNVRIVLTTGEELGCRGAKTAAFAHPADESVSIDVSFGDCPGLPEYKTARLGSGPMIGISPVLNRTISDTLQQAAKQANIPTTLEIMGGPTSTTADVLSLTGAGMPAGLVSIPLRNMHTGCEVVQLSDVEHIAALLYEYVKGGGMGA